MPYDHLLNMPHDYQTNFSERAKKGVSKSYMKNALHNDVIKERDQESDTITQ